MWRLSLLILVACSRPSDEKEARQWPDEPPPQAVQIPAALSIGVKVDGTAKAPITAETLRAATPDFVDPDRRAWRIAKLVEGADGDTTIEASTPAGMILKFPRTTPTLEPVLYLTRRGEVVVAAVDPHNPFPGYHGRGGRLHRAGDSVPRLSPVAQLEIRHVTP